MGQTLAAYLLGAQNYQHYPHSSGVRRSIELDSCEDDADRDDDEERPSSSFPDLESLPPELALEVLSKLNATDLCLAACVWQQLASDEILWQGLCREQWPHAGVYGGKKASFKRIYLRLDEGTLTFNSDPVQGMSYFVDHGLVPDRPEDIAKFFLSTRSLSRVIIFLTLDICGNFFLTTFSSRFRARCASTCTVVRTCWTAWCPCRTFAASSCPTRCAGASPSWRRPTSAAGTCSGCSAHSREGSASATRDWDSQLVSINK